MFEQYTALLPAAGTGLIAVITVLGYWRLSRALLTAKTQLQKAQHDMKLLNSSSVGLGRRVVDLEAEMQRRAGLASASGLAAAAPQDENVRQQVGEDMISVLDDLEQNSASANFPFEVHTNEQFVRTDPVFSGPEEVAEDFEQTPYTIASELLDQGVTLDQIEQRCGLSKAEVSLMATMHKNMSKFSVV